MMNIACVGNLDQHASAILEAPTKFALKSLLNKGSQDQDRLVQVLNISFK
jgi:hypothetical protein